MRAILFLLLGAFALAGLVGADHCTTWTTSQPDVAVFDEYYFDIDHCVNECMDSYWTYDESNGIPGLQRGDEVVDDTCHGMIASDTIIF